MGDRFSYSRTSERVWPKQGNGAVTREGSRRRQKVTGNIVIPSMTFKKLSEVDSTHLPSGSGIARMLETVFYPN